MSDEQQYQPQMSPQEQIAQAQHEQEVQAIVELGRANHGDAVFDQTCQQVADAIGQERLQPFIVALKQFDSPDAVLTHLANNPDRLERISKLPLQRQIVEIAKIESEHSSHGHSHDTLAQPRWTRPEARAAKISTAQFRKDGGINIKNDKDWFAAHDRAQEEKSKQRGGRW